MHVTFRPLRVKAFLSDSASKSWEKPKEDYAGMQPDFGGGDFFPTPFSVGRLFSLL